MHNDAPNQCGSKKLNLVDAKLSKLRDFANDFANVVIVVTHDKYKDDDDRNCQYDAERGQCDIVCWRVGEGNCVVIDDRTDGLMREARAFRG